MGTRRRLFYLVTIMTVVTLLVTGSVLYLVYQSWASDVTGRLLKGAQNHARLIEVILKQHGQEPEKALPLIEEAHERMLTSQQSTELLLVRRRGEQIEFLLAHRSGQHLEPQPVPFEGLLAEAARRGLRGESGTLQGLDYRGQRVIAAFEPVRGTDWAVVNKVDLEEVQGPFVRAALIGVLLDLGLVLLAAVLFVHFSDPLFQRLEESQQRFGALFHQSFNLQWTLKPDGTIVEANRTALDVAGVIVSAAVGKPFWETRWWPDTGALRGHLQTAVREAAEGTLARMEVDARGFGNRTVTLDLSFKPVTDRSGRVALLSVEARDITERKQAERELAERTAFLNALIANSPLAIVTIDPEERVWDCNPAFENLFGYRLEEMKGKTIDDFVAPGDVAAEALQLTRQAVRGETSHAVAHRRRKDGSVINVEIHGVPLVISGKLVGGYALYQDITERRRAEEERENLLRELQEALANIKTLSGLLPICASCKKIRDDGGYWSQIESYISAHSQAQFSHGICPECAKQLYPEHYHKMFPELDGEKQTRD